jgi:hypothetical protein
LQFIFLVKNRVCRVALLSRFRRVRREPHRTFVAFSSRLAAMLSKGMKAATKFARFLWLATKLGSRAEILPKLCLPQFSLRFVTQDSLRMKHIRTQSYDFRNYLQRQRQRCRRLCRAVFKSKGKYFCFQNALV